MHKVTEAYRRWSEAGGRHGTGQRFGQFYVNAYDMDEPTDAIYYCEDDGVAFGMILEYESWRLAQENRA